MCIRDRIIFSKLNEFFEDLDVKLTYSRAQTFVEYSAWALYNMIFFKDENLRYIVDNIPTCGLLLADLLEADEIGAPAKAKISLLSDKLQVLLKLRIPESIDGAEVPPVPSRRGRSRGGEGKDDEKKECKDGVDGEDEEDEEEDWNFSDS